MGLVLTAQGLQQGFMLMTGTEWVESVTAIRPYWWVRTFTGISMDIGMSLLVYNLMQTSLGERPSRAAVAR
jgi:cytochrome c oxidase cbb3-type subunit I